MDMASLALIAGFADDPDAWWSIGSFGAVGEFMRDADEPVTIRHEPGRLEIATNRGGLRIAPAAPLRPVAWDTLSGDGETWGHALAFCVPIPDDGAAVIRSLGTDRDAIREDCRDHQLFDLGVGFGATSMAVRTSDAALVTALEAAEGRELLSSPQVLAEAMRAQPHRVLISLAGRLEVYQLIPAPGDTSPLGPHTHLLPKLLARRLPHSSNVPIPPGWQAALTLHPASPWRTMSGARQPFDVAADFAFAPFLDRFGG